MAKDAALEKIDLREGCAHAGFAVRCTSGSHELSFPHVHDLTGRTHLTLFAKAEEGASISVPADGKPLAVIPLSATESFACTTVPVSSPCNEQDISLVLNGSITFDWFSFR